MKFHAANEKGAWFFSLGFRVGGLAGVRGDFFFSPIPNVFPSIDNCVVND